MTPLAGTSPAGVCAEGLRSRAAVTETARLSPSDQVAVAGPFTRASKPRRRHSGAQTISRIVSRETLLKLAVTLPFIGIGPTAARTSTLRAARDSSESGAVMGAVTCAGTTL